MPWLYHHMKCQSTLDDWVNGRVYYSNSRWNISANHKQGRFIMGIIKFIYLWGKSIVLWLLVKRNREIGFRYTKKALDVFEFASKLTATKKDDKAVAYIAE